MAVWIHCEGGVVMCLEGHDISDSRAIVVEIDGPRWVAYCDACGYEKGDLGVAMNHQDATEGFYENCTKEEAA